MILIVGAGGSMGKRYQAILKRLGKDFMCTDRETKSKELPQIAMKCDGVIVATPTDTHEEVIKSLIPTRIPILCEKPVTKDLKALSEILGLVEKYSIPFKMVYQYSLLVGRNCIGRTRYDYFKHGSDGLYWDCMQIISLARGEITLKEESPIWSCMINGQALRIQDMDAAYIHTVADWIKEPRYDLGLIKTMHEKVIATMQLDKDRIRQVCL